MPTYGYECLACDNQFEVFQSIKDEPLTTCETCGGTLRKRIYPVGIAFKGSGFYVNDYAAKPPSRPDSAPKLDAKAETAPTTSETKTESPKPEAKTEAKTETKSAAPTTA